MEGVPGGERQTDMCVCLCVFVWIQAEVEYLRTLMCSGGYAGPPHSGTSSFPTRERHQNWMKILIIQCQISQRKLALWNDKAKINAASSLSVFLLLPNSSCMRGGKKKVGGEDQRIWLCASLSASHVWELLLVCLSLRSSRVDISFVPAILCCYSVNPLEAGALQPHPLPPPDWVRGEETPRWVRCKSQRG